MIVAPIGANLDQIPLTLKGRPSAPPLKLLWVGMDWSRKGGDDCLAVLDGLLAAGVEAELHVVGCAPPRHHPRMISHGVFRKDVPEEQARLVKLYEESHLFLFPTRADMSPCVMAAAAAAGLPSMATITGGVKEPFEDGGAVFLDPNRFAAEAVPAILEMVRNGRLKEMGRRARHRFETYLNWDTIAARIVEELEQHLSGEVDA